MRENVFRSSLLALIEITAFYQRGQLDALISVQQPFVPLSLHQHSTMPRLFIKQTRGKTKSQAALFSLGKTTANNIKVRLSA